MLDTIQVKDSMSLDRLLCLPLPFFLPLLTPLSAMYESTCGDTLWVSASTSSSSASHAVLSIFRYTSWCKSFPLGSGKCVLLTYLCFCNIVRTVGVNHFHHHSIHFFVDMSFVKIASLSANRSLESMLTYASLDAYVSIHAASSIPDDSTVKPGGI